MRFIKDEKGQSLVEMALLLPILIILLVGIIDMGRFLYTNLHLHLATQETVRLAGLGAMDEELKQFVEGYFHGGDAKQLNMTVSPNQANRKSGQYVTVILEYPMETKTPIISRILPLPIMIKTESTIRIE
ncbi:pilus assembly protein TadE [Desulfuribacillus stibiiarsenatis]|uniref:Pilus assembly protein TadE n=1 Tax=Desulfuribacillus stibiiarsenatis TaxID=1390249 RepID=A0A1E5L840_9FIRM|nr:TadE/TadG family type IV pilus assembly protein [Desulfuribacillus stibiiarsenatis]OEH86184.1 pilus assembly protein TadE [Desulfuribacillus stibiiarsenatis]